MSTLDVDVGEVDSVGLIAEIQMPEARSQEWSAGDLYSQTWRVQCRQGAKYVLVE